MKAGDVVFLKDERRIRVRKIVEGGFISWRHGLFIGEENIDWVYSC